MPILNLIPNPNAKYNELSALANALTPNSLPDEYSNPLKSLADAGLDNIQTERILCTIAKGLGCSPKIIKAEYKSIKNKLQCSSDLGLTIANETLKGFYCDGLFLKRNIDGLYFLYDKTHWRATSTDVIRGNIQKVATKHKYSTDKTVTALVGDAMQCLHDLLSSDENLLGTDEVAPPVVNCRNVEVWIDNNGEFQIKPHSPNSRLFSCLEFDYKSDATCPMFEKAILEIFAKSSNPEDMVRHLWEIIGYIISGDRSNAMFLLMIGQGRNGKSMTMKTVQFLIGPNAVESSSLDTFQRDRFNAANLHGKLLFCDDDLKVGITLDDGMIKKISEKKLISARHPYGKKKFNFWNLAFPMIASNDYPNSHDISPGLIRRANIIPFDRQFTKEEDDKGLFPYIWENEMSGVLNLALQGLQRLKKRGHFLLPDDCERANKEFLAHANALYAFLNDFCEPKPDSKMRVKDLRGYYGAWAKSQGIAINREDKKLVAKLKGLQNEFGFSVTDDLKKVAYPMIYGLRVKTELIE